jgi:DAK2 domain fusion protein YloV
MEQICDAVSKGALRGARGNSGVILSQILKGITSSFNKLDEIKTIDFANALIEGATVAYKAVTKPKEGTILTVIRAMADASIKIAKKEPEMQKFLKSVIDIGEEALSMTPELLPVLKKAGVVDAGGRGLLIILNGFLKIVSGDESELKLQSETDKISGGSVTTSQFGNPEVVDFDSLADIEFAYCTEFFIININKKTTVADIDKLREKLMDIGDSVICIGDLSMVKVHVHTNNPNKALGYALELGELNGVKIENMLEQFRELKIQSEQGELKKIGVVAICAGEGLAELFKDLNVDHIIEGGQTMNPSTEDFMNAIENINARNIFIFPNNSNIIMAANQAKEISEKNIVVIPTKNTPQGFTALVNFNAEANVEENEQALMESLGLVKSGQVTYAVRDTVMNDIDVKEGNIIGIAEGKLLSAGEGVDEITTNLVEKLVDEDTAIVTLFYGEDVSEESANELRDLLEEKFEDIDVELYYGGQPLYYYLISVE